MAPLFKVVVSTLPISEIDSSTAGFANVVDVRTGNPPSESVVPVPVVAIMVFNDVSSIIAIISAILSLCDFWCYDNNTLKNTSFSTSVGIRYLNII